MPTPRLALLALLLLLPLASAGCQKEEPVAVYTVEHPGRKNLRLLAAMIPPLKDKESGEEKVYFLRLSGPEAAVAKQKEAFDQLVASLKFDEDKVPPLQWKAPAGWKEEPGGKGVRVASFRIPGEPPLELTVTGFPRSEDGQMASALANVNRWRGQLTLPPLEAGDLDKAVTRVKVDGKAVTVVDMTGVGEYTAPVVARGAPKAGLPFAFDVPKGWKKENPPARLSVESYEVTRGDKTARVTLTPLGGPAGGVPANVARWRQQVGLPEVPESELRKDVQSLEVAGLKAAYVDLDNPKHARPDNRILAAILPLEQATWFVKMTGPSDLVGAEKANFEGFVKSFKIEGK